MQHEAALKYLLDIEAVITELESIIELSENVYNKFSANFLAIRAAERDLMIIGEAVGKLLKTDPSVSITGSKDIIGLRNIIVHAYDAVDPTTLWKVLIKDLPTLKQEINDLKSS